MNKIYSEKATVCKKNSCITVYGETANIINTIAIMTTALIAIGLIAKALKA